MTAKLVWLFVRWMASVTFMLTARAEIFSHAERHGLAQVMGELEEQVKSEYGDYAVDIFLKGHFIDTLLASELPKE